MRKFADTAPAFAADPQYPCVGKLVRDLALEQIRTLDCGRRLAEFPWAEVVQGNKIAPYRKSSPVRRSAPARSA
jgi:glycerophosphoryl diester phosphodiesterase